MDGIPAIYRFLCASFVPRCTALCVCATLLAFFPSTSAAAVRSLDAQPTSTARPDGSMKAALPTDFFERNAGQADSKVRFLTKQGHGRVAIDDNGIEWSDRPFSPAEHRVLR